jgi:IS5 family transposase
LISRGLVADFLAMARKVLYTPFRNLANPVLPMKHRSRQPEQDDLLRPRLVDMIDPRHVLVKLTALIAWEVFEREWSGFFPSGTGGPATPPRLVAGLLYLQHAFRLSDEAVVARWVENPYYQHPTGETFFQHRPPIDPSSLTPLSANADIRLPGNGWRKRIGEEGVEWLLTQTIEAGRKSGAIDDASLKRVAVDTTVMEKNIAHPTDARLYDRARAQLVALAQGAQPSSHQIRLPQDSEYKFYSSEEDRTCPKCKAVHPGKEPPVGWVKI